MVTPIPLTKFLSSNWVHFAFRTPDLFIIISIVNAHWDLHTFIDDFNNHYYWILIPFFWIQFLSFLSRFCICSFSKYVSFILSQSHCWIENIFISSLLLSDSLLGFKILGWQLICFSTVIPLSSGFYSYCWEFYLAIIFVPLKIMSFCFVDVQNFSCLCPSMVSL